MRPISNLTPQPQPKGIPTIVPTGASISHDVPDSATRSTLAFPSQMTSSPTRDPVTRRPNQQRARDRRPLHLPGANLAEIAQLITRLSGIEYHSLPFPKHLELRFEAETSEHRARRFWLEGLLVLILYNLLLIADSFSTHGSFLRALLVRTGIVTPLALLVNASMLMKPNQYFREGSVAFVACLAGLSNLYLASGLDPANSAFAQFGTLAVLLFANTLMRLRFPYALAATVVMLAGDLIYMHLDHLLNLPQKVLGLLLLFGSAAATLISNYSAGREERLNYLLCLQGDLVAEELRKANQSLRHMAERDTLTGLGNRRLFNDRMRDEWERARRNGHHLSIVLIDIDHFKRINDTFGHPYGDRVLKRIGMLLLESLRRKDDLAARYGGEEFILLLPETTQDLAMLVADRIRTLVQTAGLPALDSGQRSVENLSATISCGVAGALPTRANDFQSIIDAADKALYEAKKSGRNRTCAAA